MSKEKAKMIKPEHALVGRDLVMGISGIHTVTGNTMSPPFPSTMEQATFALGCFWGAERKFWQQKGIFSTAVGYCAGYTPNPIYEEVCSGSTGHTEAVFVVFDPEVISYTSLLKLFWESHNPTQGMRQGNDIGTQYRSGIYTHSVEQTTQAELSMTRFQTSLDKNNIGKITTELKPAGEFYYAEEHHQQYLDKNPNGYCGLSGCGVSFEY